MKDTYFHHLRHNIIHDFLLKGEGSTKDLLKKINAKILEFDPNKIIGLRSLQNDLNSIIKQGIDIEKFYPEGCDKRSPCIRYKDPDFKMDTLDLTQNQKNTITDAFVILDRFIGKPGWEWLENIIDQRNDSLNIDQFMSKKISYTDSSSIISPKISRILAEIKIGLFEKIPLEISRTTNNNKEDRFVIHPHYLKFNKNKWYLLGYNKKNRAKVWVVPIDKRIAAVSQSNEKFIKSDIDYEEPIDGGESYFDPIIGVTNHINKSPIKIVLRIYDKAKFNKIDTNPPHHSYQVVDKKESFVDVSFYIKENRELFNFLKENIEGVEHFHQVRARRMGPHLLVDLHIEVNYIMSVSAAHQVAEKGVELKVHAI